MKHNIPTKTLKNGFEMPALGIGTWPMGGFAGFRDPDNNDDRDISAIRYALDNGFTAIDTAEMYAGGYSETLVQGAISGYHREKLFISSKVRGDNCSYQAIKNACKNSLKRMNIEYIDLYYIHWRDQSFSLQDSMKAMNELVDEGYIRYIGVSNFSKETLIEAQSYSKHPIVANQVHYNIIFREPETSGLLDYCQKNDVMLVAWRPLELGKLANSGSRFIITLSVKYQQRQSAIALNWLMSQKNVTTLFKSSNTEHIDINLESLGFDIGSSDLLHIRDDFPSQIHVSDAVPLG